MWCLLYLPALARGVISPEIETVYRVFERLCSFSPLQPSDMLAT